ncbi:hypothetical protein AALO_G00086370 [Alosa alosa]|uniref:Uncharacterized protein n=1 Tax=Alosa alosa TaxID=278164 RepID=A0AAV6GYK8_9TELE|nr:hypothetical protein AALO_G00086370 [Alosa alosa]
MNVSLSQPNISVSAPEGELVLGPHGPEVRWGQSFSIVCSTKPQYQGGSFHLIFDSSDMDGVVSPYGICTSLCDLWGNTWPDAPCDSPVLSVAVEEKEDSAYIYVINDEYWPMTSFEVLKSAEPVKTEQRPSQLEEEVEFAS